MHRLPVWLLSAALLIAACTSSADVGSDSPVIGGENVSGAEAEPSEPTTPPEPPTPEPTTPPEPAPTPEPAIEEPAPTPEPAIEEPTPAPEPPTPEPTTPPIPESTDTDPGSTQGDPALEEVTGRWAELGCQNGLITRTVLGESEIGEVVEQIPFQVWVCVSGDEVLEELLCYVDETEEILTAMETQLGDSGVRAAAEFRRTNAIFCSNPFFARNAP